MPQPHDPPKVANERAALTAASGRPIVLPPRLSPHGARQRELVIQCAAELFDRIGYHRTRMDEVAAAAGLRKSSLYHYFSTKDDLLVSIHTAFMAFLHAQVEEPTRASLDPVAFLQAVVEDIVRSVDSYPHHVRVFFDHYRELPEPARLELSRSRDRYAAKIEEVIAEGMRAGYFRVGDSHLAMLAFFGVCNWTYAWYRPGGKLGPEEVADFLARFALGGLASNEPSRPQ